jgi:hypothetical protein
MGRLTINIDNEWCVNGVGYTCCEEYCKERLNECEDCLIYEAISKLAHYEDMEEAGRLIELPCAVGDTVYHIRDPLEGEPSIVKVKFSYFWLEQWDTTFLTKEEAEAKLKELEGDHFTDADKMGKE